LKKFFAPADTFDNVKGQFPIGFFIWNTNKKEVFENVIADIYDKNANFIGTKGIYALMTKINTSTIGFPFTKPKRKQHWLYGRHKRE
jgi:hypothetical protein